MSEQNTLLPNLKTNGRKEPVKNADLENLVKGVALLAAGILAASCITTELSFPVRGFLFCAGTALCVIGVPFLMKYYKEAEAFRKYVPQWDKGRGIYDRMAKELNIWYEEGEEPVSCDGDTRYYLKLQKERLEEKGLRMQNVVRPVKGESFGTATYSRKSVWYTTDMVYEEINRELRFLNGSETLYQREVEQVMYEIVVHSPNEKETEHLMITCPNCGAVSPVSQLMEGCCYCGTQFRMKDLFPRVVNTYFIKTTSIGKHTSHRRKIMGISMGVFLLLFLPGAVISSEGVLPVALFTSYLAAIICGGVGGFTVTSIWMIASLFQRDGMKHLSLFSYLGTKVRMKNMMSRWDPNFAYDKFEGQMVALIRMAVFAKDVQNLTAYCGGKRDERFENILEMTYTNGMCLKKVRREGSFLHLTLRTWWINYSLSPDEEKGNRIIKTGDLIDVTLGRNLAHREMPGFSITSVNCRSCGGSFDAVRQRKCPYCGTEYHMEEDYWVIEDMKLIR